MTYIGGKPQCEAADAVLGGIKAYTQVRMSVMTNPSVRTKYIPAHWAPSHSAPVAYSSPMLP